MRILKLKLGSSDLVATIDFLINNLKFDYENHSTDMSVLTWEEYYFRKIQFNMIIVKKEQSHILIDIIGGAGGAGILKITWWSEKRYTNRVRKVLEKYVHEFNFSLEEIESL